MEGNEKQKHKALKRYKQYHSGDFYSYNLICSCGKEFHEWSKIETEEKFNNHLKGGHFSSNR